MDVRNAAERVVGYLEYSTLIPLPIFEEKIKTDENLLPKNKTIFVLCKTGVRACIVCSILSKYGYTDIVNIDGGMDKLI